ncbi:MAG: GTPase Era [Spirochaetota bacterium]
MKSGLIAVVGRPSSGKSTLLNTICGQKVSITAPSPQTTRNTVRGILSEERGQLVFLDTPGYHNSQQKFNRFLKQLAHSTLEEADVILYVLDPRRAPGPEETQLMQVLADSDKPVIAAINKTDLNPPRLAEVQQRVAEQLPHSLAYPISALNGFGVRDLIAGLFLQAPEGELMYPQEYYTDQDPEFRITEIIREQAVNRVREELPHALYVEIADMEMQEERHLLWTRAVIYVERESQKGIIVGKQGSMIKKIRVAAEQELAELFPYAIKLDLRVKVDPKWRSRDGLLEKLIH